MNKNIRLNVRPFNEEDQAEVRQLILEGLKEHFASFDPSLNTDLDDIARYYLMKGNYVAVVEWGSLIVGSGALISETLQRARIVRVSISREHRGRGIGTALVNHLIHEAYGRAYSKIVVETNRDWLAAISLYKKCGFVRYDTDEESIHLAFFLERFEN